MQLIRSLHNLHPKGGCVASIGNFDGIHRGHQAILAQLRARAEALQLPSCVVIFEPQPREFFTPHDVPARLTCLREKLALLGALQVDQVLCLAFNRRLRELGAAQFVRDVLVRGLNVRHVELGDDFRFGCDRSGDFNFLRQVGHSAGFSVEAAPTLLLNGERVSSTAVRQALAKGDLLHAAHLLGRPYAVCGRVIHGQHLGRHLGAPTANVQLKRRRVALSGVFTVSAQIDDRVFAGVANIGVRPSVRGDGLPHLEVHLLDYQGDLYGRSMQVVFRHKLRDEQRFASLEALQQAIAIDIAAARTYWASTPL